MAMIRGSKQHAMCAAVCDPVMGDDGKLYVKPEIPPVYRQALVCTSAK